MCIAKCTWMPPRPPKSPTCGRHSPMRVRSPAMTQIASRSGQRSWSMAGERGGGEKPVCVAEVVFRYYQ